MREERRGRTSPLKERERRHRPSWAEKRTKRKVREGECSVELDFFPSTLFFFFPFSLSISSLHYLMNLASLTRRPQTTSPFLPSAPLFLASRRHHQSRKMASVTAYIEEKDLAAKVRKRRRSSKGPARGKKRADARRRAETNVSRGSEERRSRKERSNFSARHAPLFCVLAGPLWRISIVLSTKRGAQRKRAPETRAMREKRSKPFFPFDAIFFRPQVEQRRCLSFWKKK